MLNNIDSSISSGLQEAQSTISANKVRSGSNNSESKLYLVDEGDISQQALELYQLDKDIEKYTNMLCSDEITEQEANEKVAALFESGVLSVSDDDLAESMINDTSLINDLYTNVEAE